MTPLTNEWVAKVEGDFATARREMRARINPNYDAACFHAQQCAEKYLKAALQEAGAPFPKTHDLAALSDLLEPTGLRTTVAHAELRALNAFAVAFRYPGETADREAARDAVEICRRVRLDIRSALGLTR